MFRKKQNAISVLFQPFAKRVCVKGEKNVLELALNNKIEIDNSCGGSGSCGTCRIKVLSDLEKCSPVTDVEQAMVEDRNFEPKERLACQLEPHDDLEIEIPES